MAAIISDIKDSIERAEAELCQTFGIFIHVVNDVAEVARIPLKESYLMMHDALPNRSTDRPEANLSGFKYDLKTGIVKKGMSVVYHKGALCGRSQEDVETFYAAAARFYGSSNLAVFRADHPDRILTIGFL